jgi:hypothetical protein
MTDGPSERQIQRVREALEQHDSELRDEDPPAEDEGDEPSEDGEEDG